MARKHDPQSVVGKKFGKLTILPEFEIRLSDRTNSFYYLCQCDCGNKKFIRLTDFKTGRTKSCGCIQREIAANIGNRSKLPYGESPINSFYGQYIKSAKDRNISFELTKDEFKEMIRLDCYYCGCKPYRAIKTRYSWHDDFLLLNGVDRKNGKIGYVKENCVPCCPKCNYAKNNLNEEDFLDLVKKIFYNRIHE